jgi:hypothetical protein
MHADGAPYCHGLHAEGAPKCHGLGDDWGAHAAGTFSFQGLSAVGRLNEGETNGLSVLGSRNSLVPVIAGVEKDIL